MTTRTIEQIEEELAVARRLDDTLQRAVEASDRVLVDLVFAASSHKRLRLLERELSDAKSRLEAS